ncbi:MKRN2 opposite strand protein [Harpegnathos saltator]|uniref:MKRN2 opposite strand protein n=1 Tax=Harpegnathos saltator TaxID=610380 RepID=E2BE74_HARSA|nr:MKRN2 opposite strand protein [Harpegnathos saltator]EFN86011.1 hypothetical protein EAI_10686 [Harpegnathos saltator]
MDNDPGIMCFRHCPAKSVFCRNVPATCPVCSSHIHDFFIIPFRVPYPLTNAGHNPTSVVIRPARGSFLEDYNAAQDLHIGIVDSTSNIVEFDRNGLIVNNVMKWTDCVAFKVVPVAWTVQWDNTLSSMLRDPKWKSANYNEISMNCFDFVLEFFNILSYEDLKFTSKEDLCRRLILSKIQNVIKYSSLYKVLKNQEYVISNKYV